MRFACIVLVLAIAACGQQSVGQGDAQGSCEWPAKPANVLLVVVDTLREDHLGIYGYKKNPTTPFLDAFTREQGIRFDGLIGVSSWTMPSMATLFSGKTPAEHGVMRMMGEHSRFSSSTSLAERFQAAGWKTAAVQSNFLLQNRRMLGFNRGFQSWNDEAAAQSDPHRGSTADLVATRGLDWLGKQSGEDSWFLYLHFFDPHSSYEDHGDIDFTNPDYQGWVKGGLSNDELRANGPQANAADRAQLANLYDEEIRAVDNAFAKVISYLKTRPDWENTLVVFTADHGEELAERGYIGHTRTLHFEQTNLPLVVRLPNGAHGGNKVDYLVSQSQVAGSILDLAGVAQDDLLSFAKVLHGDGFRASCFGDYQVELEPLGYAEPIVIQTEVDFIPVRAEHVEKRVHKRGLVANEARYIFDLESGQESLFFLNDDPAEQLNQVSNPKFEEMLNDFRWHLENSKWWEPK